MIRCAVAWSRTSPIAATPNLDSHDGDTPVDAISSPMSRTCPAVARLPRRGRPRPGIPNASRSINRSASRRVSNDTRPCGHRSRMATRSSPRRAPSANNCRRCRAVSVPPLRPRTPREPSPAETACPARCPCATAVRLLRFDRAIVLSIVHSPDPASEPGSNP